MCNISKNSYVRVLFGGKKFSLLFGDNCVLYFGKAVANERRHYLDNAKVLKDMFCEYLKTEQFDSSVTQYNSVGSCWR